MADIKFDDFDGGFAASGEGRFGRLINLAGAACSVALIVGLAVWGYKLAVRDVNGVPVFRALAGPLRVAPDNPGGDVMAHQGLSVNAIASAGLAMPLPETVTLAPQSAALQAEDVAGLVIADAPAVAPGDVTISVAMAPVSDLGAADDLAPLMPVEIAAAEPAAVIDPIPMTQQDAVELALAEALAGTGDLAADETTPVLIKSVRPKSRPNASEAAVSDIQTVAAIAPLEMGATTIAAGTRLVQLGAFDDEAAARAEWAKLQGRFTDLMTAKAMVVQPAQSGGRMFFRLRAHGFGDEDDARRFCAALLAENASCIPVSQR